MLAGSPFTDAMMTTRGSTTAFMVLAACAISFSVSGT